MRCSSPTTLTDRPGLWLHNLRHKALVGGSLFWFPSLSPRSCRCSMGITSQYILLLLSQHLPDLEQQSLDGGSVSVGTGLCRREEKRDDKHLTRLEILSWRHQGPSSLCPEAEIILGLFLWFLLPVLTLVKALISTSLLLQSSSSSSLLLPGWQRSASPGWQEAGAALTVSQASSQGNKIKQKSGRGSSVGSRFLCRGNGNNP